jgi:hypothetical protein
MQLQTRLHNEKTLRMGLEQALGEASDPCMPQYVSVDLAPEVSPMHGHDQNVLILCCCCDAGAICTGSKIA